MFLGAACGPGLSSPDTSSTSDTSSAPGTSATPGTAPAAEDETICRRIVPESVSPSIACTPKQFGADYDGCSTNLACGAVHGCLVERYYPITRTVPSTYQPGPLGFQPPATSLPPMGMPITGKGTGWFSRGDGTQADGSCLLPPVKNIMAAAMNGQDFGNGEWCGACAEVVGRSGTRVRIQIVTKCMECEKGQLDIASGKDSPYELLNLPEDFRMACNGLPLTWKIVPCETEGSIVLHYMWWTNEWTPAVQVRNNRIPIVKMEDFVDGAWRELKLEESFYRLVPRYSNTDVPYTIRITAIDGATITATFPAALVYGEADYETTSQF